MFDGQDSHSKNLFLGIDLILGVILSKFRENFSDLCEILGGF